MRYGVGVAKKDKNAPTLVKNINGNKKPELTMMNRYRTCA